MENMRLIAVWESKFTAIYAYIFVVMIFLTINVIYPLLHDYIFTLMLNGFFLFLNINSIKYFLYNDGNDFYIKKDKSDLIKINIQKNKTEREILSFVKNGHNVGIIFSVFFMNLIISIGEFLYLKIFVNM